MIIDNTHFYSAMGVATACYATAIVIYAKKLQAAKRGPRMSKYVTIRLPLQEDGATVHRTLKGEWLVGIGDESERPWISQSAEWDDRKQWGYGYWYVIRSASGKLVVYQQPLEDEGAPSVAIYDSFEAMQPHVPSTIYEEALQKAGLKEPPQFPEAPLEGV